MSLTINVNLTLFIIPCKTILGSIDLQCCNYPHLLSGILFKFQSSMTNFHYILVRMQNIPKVDKLEATWDENTCKIIHKKCR